MRKLYRSCPRCDEAIAQHARMVAHHEAKYNVKYPLSVAEAARLITRLCYDANHIDLDGTRRSPNTIKPIDISLRERKR